MPIDVAVATVKQSNNTFQDLGLLLTQVVANGVEVFASKVKARHALPTIAFGHQLGAIAPSMQTLADRRMIFHF